MSIALVFTGCAFFTGLFSTLATSQQEKGSVASSDYRAIKWVAPYHYPAVLEHETGMQGGRVTIEAMVGPDGRVYWTNVVDAARIPSTWYRDFETVAKRWRFEPRPQRLAYKVRIEFLFTVLPSDSPDSEMVTLFTEPSTVEIRLVSSQPRTIRDPRLK